MSSENRRPETPREEPVFTIYPGYNGTVNYGIVQDPSQVPPPKYEDVVSGEYLKQNYTACRDATPSQQNQRGVIWTCPQTTTLPPPPLPQSEPPEVNKKKKAVGVLIFAAFLVVILIFRVYCFI